MSRIDSTMEKVKDDVKLLQDLIRQHDVIFLLTDSRESRWLPTVIASVEQKVRRIEVLSINYHSSSCLDCHMLCGWLRFLCNHSSWRPYGRIEHILNEI